jgi:hypothetical protein
LRIRCPYDHVLCNDRLAKVYDKIPILVEQFPCVFQGPKLLDLLWASTPSLIMMVVADQHDIMRSNV